MSKSESNYGVDVYQINVGQGDGAIYIQFENIFPNKKKVLSAVLIDGGQSEKTLGNIRRTVDHIKEAYAMAEPLRFDTVVVTHWDADHVCGVIHFIQTDLEEGQKAKPKRKCQFLKYDLTTKKPQTVMYLPYWRSAESASKLKKLKDADKWTSVFKKQTDINGNETNVLEWYLGEEGAQTTISDVVLVRHTPQTMLGVDFFLNNTSPVGNNYLKVISLEVLLSWEADNVDKNKPGLLCICTDRILLGPTKKTGKKGEDGDEEDDDDDDEDEEDEEGNSDTGATMTKLTTTNDNKVSIVTLVVWRKSKEIAYYAAGDLDDSFETKILKWSHAGIEKFEVAVVKASHHGAPGSFPQDMIQMWRPHSIIFSCGAKHHHPGWEIIYWISEEVYYKDRAKPIWSTTYPSWLTIDYKDLKGRPVFLEQKEEYWLELKSLSDKKYLKGLQKLYGGKKPGPGGLAVGTLNGQLTELKDKEERANQLFRLLSTKWKEFSNTTAESTSATAQTNAGGGVVTWNDQVWYILIQCRSTGTSVLEYRNDGNPRKSGVIVNTPDQKPVKSSISASYRDSLGKRSFTSWSPQKPKEKKIHSDVPASELETTALVGKGQSTEVERHSFLHQSSLKQGYRIYAKVVEDEVEHDVVTVTERLAFVEQLNRQVLEFISRPSGNEVAFQEDDELYMWFKNTLSTTKLVARGTGKEVDHFDMVIPFATNSLRFSTEAIPLQFKMENFTSPFSDKWGLLKEFPVMIFGLDHGGSDFEILISDVYKFAGWKTKPGFDAKVKLVHPLSGDGSTLYKRNAIWFMPGNNYFTTMRLNFQFPESKKLKEFLQTFLGEKFDLTDANVAVRKEYRYNLLAGSSWNASVSSEMVLDCTVTVRTSESDIGAKVTSVLSDDTQSMELFIDFSGAELGKLLSWLKELLNITFELPMPPAKYIGEPSVRRIALRFDDKKCTSAAVTFQLLFKFGAEETEDVVFFLTYAWPQNQLTGTLYPGAINKNVYDVGYEPYRVLKPDVPDEDKLADGLHLAHIIPGGSSIPIPEHVLPTITSANVTLGSDRLSIAGQLTWNSEGGSMLPIVKLDSINLSLTHNWSSNTVLYLDVRARLVPRLSDLRPVSLFGSISYESQNQKWSFKFGLNNLHLSTLYSFFDSDVNEGVMDMMETVVIEKLHMTYDYSSSGKSKSFLLRGSLLLGPIKADFKYTHNLNDWSFDIDVGPNSVESSIGDIMRSLVGENIFLPSCVDTIKIATSEDKLFSIRVRKSPQPKYLIFHGKFNAGMFGFSFVQLRKAGKEKTISTKRILKVVVDKLPEVDVPVVGMLPQVFEEMMFLWVDDSLPEGEGLTRAEVEFLNTALPDEKIRFKENKPQNPDNNDIVLQRGLHFLITLKQMGVSKVVLDHCFGKTKKPTNPDQSGSSKAEKNLTGSGETSMAPMEKKLGPLSISNIGLQFLNDTLYIILDATFELGPVKMSILGFGLGVELSGDFNLQTLPKRLALKLEGLSVSFQKPPLTLAGSFRKEERAYRGGIAVGYVPYSFHAAGFYEDMEKFRTVFVFVKLSGPLITLGYVEISGICGGFGYNNTIGYPTITEVPTYPFIDSTSLGTDPIAALNKLSEPKGWVQPKEDVNWLMVGLSARVFGLLDVDAVVVVELNPVKLGIFALARAGFPIKAKHDKRFLYVSLGIGAVVDFQMGTMKVEGQLTPDSFILSPSCHPTGGFGLFHWFGPNEHAGDWVFTIGGYHPSFIKPVHYPNPPRLGISWQVASALSIIGESYFAINPKCCMAGCHLRATLSLGPLEAWFDAQIHLLMNFDPFYFEGKALVTIGISITLRMFICTLHVKAEVGATLYIHGTPFGGRVNVNFWVCAFNIEFGLQAEKPVTVDLQEFWKMCLQDGVSPPGQGRQNVSDHVLTVSSGLLPTSHSDSQIWDVRGSIFSFTIQSRFAIKDAKVNGDGGVEDKTPIYAKPMQRSNQIHESHMSIKIKKEQANVKQVDKWLLRREVTSAPDALWGQYDSSQDPIKSGNQIPSLLKPDDSVKIQLTMGITVSSPRPVLAGDEVPKFNFIHAMSIDVNSTKYPSFPKYDDDIGKDFEPVAPVKGAAQWTKVKEAWGSDTAKTNSESVMKAWRTAYMWEDTKIVALPPERAICEFETVYMAAPLMCA